MTRTARVLLVAALVAVVVLAFRVSWNALRDVARATGADGTAALLYPVVVDGLMALALVATLVLTGDARRHALRVLGSYTIASLVLNYVHGMVPDLHTVSDGSVRLAGWDPAHWALVLLATSLPVGSIFFGSDLVAKVLHHRSDPITNQEESTGTERNRSTPDLAVSTPATPAAPIGPAGSVGVNAVRMPTRVPVGFLKSTLPHKPLAAIGSAPIAPVDRPAVRGSIAAESARVRRATGRVPDVARSARPRRTADDLLTEARRVTADWPDADLTAEGIRRAVRTSPVRARALRETLRAERAGTTA
ncbi:DUF2637 domain-containing protein [Streptomyces uncialis]|uniref:DUF2637 domain-containing protein n=1 Tax=Streptomyces uncialis TaxID=1048205 RepID=UPI0038182E8C